MGNKQKGKQRARVEDIPEEDEDEDDGLNGIGTLSNIEFESPSRLSDPYHNQAIYGMVLKIRVDGAQT